MDENDYPLDIKINSAFLGKQKELEYVDEAMGGQPLNLTTTTFYIPPKPIIYKYLSKTICKAANANINLNELSQQKVTIFHTHQNVIRFGIYLDEFIMEFGLIPYLNLDGVQMNYDFNSISFELTLDFLKINLNLNNVISKLGDGAIKKNVQNKKIKIKWNRKYSYLCTKSFYYVNDSANVNQAIQNITNNHNE